MRARNTMSRHPLKICAKLSLVLFLVFGCGSFLSSDAIAQTRDWQPQHTWVFVVGTLRWQHRDLFDSFPQKNRRDAQLVEFFKQQGVPAQQMVYLQDAQATTRQVKTAFAAFLAKAGAGDFLFVYYCGHGYQSDDERTTYFATYDASDETPGWSTDSIVQNVEKYFKGSRAFLTADCCYSGSLVRDARRFSRRVSFACLTSASASELSTGNWTFTEMLVAGLSGKAFADRNNDGQITLSELAQDVQDDMAFAEAQSSSFTTTGSFAPETVIAPAARKVNPEISKRVEVRSEGKWWKARVVDAKGGTFRVHYFGYEDSDDEWVRLSQIRESPVVRYPAGTDLDVIRKLEWYPAKAVRVESSAPAIQNSRNNGGVAEGAPAGSTNHPQNSAWRTDKIQPWVQ